MSKYLVGKIILDVKIADDQKALLFVTDAGDVVAKVDGDCCSSSWVENIELPFKGLPATVVALEDIELPGAREDEYERLQVYGLKIITNKGDFVIDYRNASNGYYGGSLSWPDDEYFYGGVHGQNISTQQWIDLATFAAMKEPSHDPD